MGRRTPSFRKRRKLSSALLKIGGALSHVQFLLAEPKLMKISDNIVIIS